MTQFNSILISDQINSDLINLSEETGVSVDSLAELAISLGLPETPQKTSSASEDRTLGTAQSQLSG